MSIVKRVESRPTRRASSGESVRALLRRAAFEALESRQLLSATLLPDVPPNASFGYPQIVFDSTVGDNGLPNAGVTYNATTHAFTANEPLVSVDLSGDPSGVDLHLINPLPNTDPLSVLSLNMTVDNAANLTPTAPGTADLTLNGWVDLNDDFTLDAGDIVSSPGNPLLTAHLTAFGSDFSAAGAPNGYYMNYRLTTTGGQLASYFAGSDIGVVMVLTNTSAPPSFAGDFKTDAQGTVGAIAPGPTPSHPLLTTQAGGELVVGSGAALNDTATLSGGANPTGKIVFTLYDPNNIAVYTDEVTVNGNGNYSTAAGNHAGGYVPTVAGGYQWVAHYFGDTNNSEAYDDGKNEGQAVDRANPSLTTHATGPVLVGSGAKLNDTATLGGAFNATGTITFTLYDGATVLDTEVVNVNGNGDYATPNGYLPTAAGDFHWVAQYSGDTNNATAHDQGGAQEEAVVNQAHPTIITQAGPTFVIGSGTKVTDTAHLSGGYNVTGNISFQLFDSLNHLLYTDVVAVSGAGDYSTATGDNAGGYLPTAVDTYRWVATYSGDDNNTSATDNGANELQTVTAATPTIVTQAGGAVVIGSGAKLTDTATLSGAYKPGGTITFKLTAPGGAVVDTETVTVTANGSYTTPNGYVPTTTVGSYLWSATYSGDANNGGASDNGVNENETVNKASPAIKTTPGISASTGSGTFATIGFWHNQNGQALIKSFDTGPNSTLLGNSLASNYPKLFGTAGAYLSASLAGQTNAQVAADYLNLWTPSGLQKNTYVQAFAVALGNYSSNGGGTFNVGSNGAAFGVANNTTISIGALLTALNNNFNPATGQFYNGDSTLTSAANNVFNAINTAGETPGGVTVLSSAKLTDSATLSGGVGETGTITFYLMAPGSTASTPLSQAVYTDTVTVSGNGTYTTDMGNNPGGYSTTTVGTYQWVAVYSGDTKNYTVTSPFGEEPEVVGQQSPTITTTPNVTTATLGGSSVVLTDTATIAGGVSPTGTLTWNLVFNGNVVDTESIAVNGNGSNYTTPHGYALPTTGTVTGTYQWNVTYSGDANNAGDTFVNDPSERTVVSPAKPALSTTPGGSITVGSGAKMTDSATLTGGYHQGGTLTFYLMAPGATASTPLSQAVYTDTVTVSNDGTYSTATGTSPGGYAPTAGGTYQWVVAYSGDGNNQSTVGNFGDEPELATVQQPPKGTISGTKYQDLTGNGFSADDTPLAGVTIDLFNNSTATGTPVAKAVTDSHGNYSFTNLAPGTYTVKEEVPAGQVMTGPANLAYYTIQVASGTTSTGNNFDDFVEDCDLSDFSNITYLINGCTTVTDLRGHIHAGDTVTVNFTVNPGIPAHQLTLVSYNAPGATFDANTASQQTIYQQATGTFAPGPHSLSVKVPAGCFQIDFVCGAAIDHFGPAGSNIFYTPEGRLISADNGCGCDLTPVQKGEFATIGFWKNQNGQAVIKSFNGSSTATQLGNWMASNFPHLFGVSNPYTGTSLGGLTNAQIASVYASTFGTNGGAKNTYLQAFAVALGLYSDTTSLGGQSLINNGLAAKYGFHVTSDGAGTFNVGSNGAAFGVANNTSVTVFRIMQIVDAAFNPSNGTFYNNSSTLTSAANNVLNGINTGGDITLVTSDSTSVGEDAALVTDLHPLSTGTMVVAVDALPGDAAQQAAEQARVDDAIASVNATLGSRGVTLVEIQGDDSVAADVHIHFANTSSIGGVADGVLGVTQAGGEITIINGWNYNFSADPAGAGQYDFETVLSHELGHSIGLGHSTDANSVMFPFLGTAQTRRTLTDNDLAVIDSDGGTAPEPLRAAPAVVQKHHHHVQSAKRRAMRLFSTKAIASTAL